MRQKINILLISANLSNFEKKHSDDIIHSLDEKFRVSTLYLNDKNFPARINSLHPRLQAKIPKMLAWEYFQEYDYYLWLDGAYHFLNEKSLNNILNSMCQGDFSIVKHWDRNSILEEFDFIAKKMNDGDEYLINRYKNELMGEQVGLYLSTPQFEDNALYAGGFFVYSKNLVLTKPDFFRDWYYHCARYSIQDQLSLPYLLWKHKVSVNEFDRTIITENLLHDRIG